MAELNDPRLKIWGLGLRREKQSSIDNPLVRIHFIIEIVFAARPCAKGLGFRARGVGSEVHELGFMIRD